MSAFANMMANKPRDPKYKRTIIYYPVIQHVQPETILALLQDKDSPFSKNTSYIDNTGKSLGEGLYEKEKHQTIECDQAGEHLWFKYYSRMEREETVTGVLAIYAYEDITAEQIAFLTQNPNILNTFYTKRDTRFGAWLLPTATTCEFCHKHLNPEEEKEVWSISTTYHQVCNSCWRITRKISQQFDKKVWKTSLAYWDFYEIFTQTCLEYLTNFYKERNTMETKGELLSRLRILEGMQTVTSHLPEHPTVIEQRIIETRNKLSSHNEQNNAGEPPRTGR